MTMKAKPLQNAPPLAFGERGGPQRIDDDKAASTLTMEVKKGQVKDEPESPSMELGLGIGADSPRIKDGKSLFTRAQLHELQQQLLIFRYIAAGLPVPPPLVLPIWKSGASFFGSAVGIAAISRQFPSFVGFSPQGFDYRHMMDPQPGRCRRTDGKKWRCSKSVVPNHKYCERHMHRGCRRSRKLVDASQTTAASDKTLPNSLSKNPENSNSNDSNLTPVRPQLQTMSLSNTSISSVTASGIVDIKITGTAMTATANANHKNTTTTMTTKAIIGPKNTCMRMIINAVHEGAATGTATIDNKKNSSIDINKQDIDGEDRKCSISVSDKNIINRSSNRRNIKNGGSNISQGLDFSPKSVLQVPGCSASHFYTSDLELEPGRCRRTDGRKWRCRRDVVANQKYCEMHMHRGAKKHVEASQPAAFPKAIRDVSSCANPDPAMVLPNKADCMKLNTNFSMSILASPHLMSNDNTSTTSSSSDTTISDTMIGTYQTRNFSS